jgi:DNA-binding NarL/FixJ family response regulator
MLVERKTKRELLQELDALRGRIEKFENAGGAPARKAKSKLQQSTSTNSYAGKPLTISEMKVLKLIVGGMSNKEIAQSLHRSIRTIEGHRAHIMRKLGVDNSVELVKQAAVMGLVELPVKQGQGKAT